WSDELRAAFQSALKASDPAVPASALPLIARWDIAGTMATDLKSLVTQLLAKLNDSSAPDEQRAQLAASLLGVRDTNPDIVPSVAKLIGSSASPALQKRVISSLGSSSDP